MKVAALSMANEATKSATFNSTVKTTHHGNENKRQMIVIHAVPKRSEMYPVMGVAAKRKVVNYRTRKRKLENVQNKVGITPAKNTRPVSLDSKFQTA